MKGALRLTLSPSRLTGRGLTLATTSYLCFTFHSDFYTSGEMWPQPRKTQIYKEINVKITRAPSTSHLLRMLHAKTASMSMTFKDSNVTLTFHEMIRQPYTLLYLLLAFNNSVFISVCDCREYGSSKWFTSKLHFCGDNFFLLPTTELVSNNSISFLH